MERIKTIATRDLTKSVKSFRAKLRKMVSLMLLIGNQNLQGYWDL